MTWVAVLATVGGAVIIANAVAQDPAYTVDAVGLSWQPSAIEDAEPGDTVRWEFDQATQAHNLFLETPSGEMRHLSLEAGCTGGPPGEFGGQCPPGSPPIDYTFEQDAEEGRYYYICTIHSAPFGGPYRDGMVGTIDVGEGEPPPPLDPHLPNPTDSPGPPWEIGTQPPRMLGVNVKGINRGVRLRMRLTHPGRVNVRFRRGGKVVLKRNLKNLRQGANTRKVRSNRLRNGRYQVVLRYFDRWGLPAQPRVVKRQVRLRY